MTGAVTMRQAEFEKQLQQLRLSEAESHIGRLDGRVRQMAEENMQLRREVAGQQGQRDTLQAAVAALELRNRELSMRVAAYHGATSHLATANLPSRGIPHHMAPLRAKP